MPKLIISVTDENEERLRAFTHKRGDLSRVVNDALSRHLAELEKQRLRKLSSAKNSIGEFYRERRFGRLLSVHGRFTLEGADLQVNIDDTQQQKIIQEIERGVDAGYRKNWPPSEIGEQGDVRRVDETELTERSFYLSLKDRIEAVNEWAEKILGDNGIHGVEVRIRFDPDTGLKICERCKHPGKEFVRCWNCGF
jgi:hypothetical protein